MIVEYVPLLRIARDLYRVPRGRARFEAYLHELRTDDRTDCRLPPLVAMNPMAKDHVPALIDAYLKLDADAVARRAIEEMQAHVAESPGTFRLGLAIADDAMGGWTHRAAVDHDARFHFEATLHRGWISALLWSSEPADAELLRTAVATAVLRTAHVTLHGMPRTLRAKIEMERDVWRTSGRSLPGADAATLARVRAAIAPLLDATDMRTAVECLFGDSAAAALGFTERGLPPWSALTAAPR